MVFGALAIVLVAVFVITRPPALRNEDASGAIGAVEKHHQAQITPQDVVLGDEATKEEQAVVYGDMLNDAAKLQSFSAEFGAMAGARADDSRISAASKNLANADEALQARYAKYAGSFVTAASRLAAKSENRKLESDIADLGSRLNSKLASSDQDALNARMGSIIAVLSKMQSRGAEASRVSEAMSALQAKSPEAASKLNSAADALEARQLGASLESIHANLAAITMQSKAISAAQSSLAARTESKSLDAKALNGISNDLAQNAAELESRGYNNLASRLNDQAEMGARLQAISAEVAAKTQSINFASAMASKNDNISSAMSRLNAALASRQAEFASRAAASINFAQRDLASRALDARVANRSAANREAASRALNSMQQLGSRPEVASKLDSRSLASISEMQSRLASKAN